MKLYATVTSERGKPVSKGGNTEIVIDLNIERVEIGRVVMRHDVNGVTFYYYPIGKGGRTLLHEER